jgi:hypothetical protein
VVTLFTACRAADGPVDVEVVVQRVTLDETSRSPVVVLEDKAHARLLPIWIGPAEAQAIAMRMEGIEPPRPMTHDLMKQLLEQAGLDLQRVVIHDLQDSTYYARLHLSAGGRDVEIDSRPSDAIALAVRCERPIFVRAALMKAAGTQAKAGDAEMRTVAGITVQHVSEDLAEHFGLARPQGVLVSSVARNAAVALQPGDVVLEVDGEAVAGVADFDHKLAALERGGDLAVHRRGRRIHVRVRPGRDGESADD